MSREALEHLLCEADASARRPAAQGDLVARVRRLDRRRRTVRLAKASAASLLLLAAAGLWVWDRGPSPPGESGARAAGERRAPTQTTADLLARAARLEEQADRMSAVLTLAPAVHELDRRIGRLQAILWEVEAASPLQRREEEAAKALYLAAARLEEQPRNRSSAIETYRSVIRQFPGSISAQLAKKSLPRLEKAEGEPS